MRSNRTLTRECKRAARRDHLLPDLSVPAQTKCDSPGRQRAKTDGLARARRLASTSRHARRGQSGSEFPALGVCFLLFMCPEFKQFYFLIELFFSILLK